MSRLHGPEGCEFSEQSTCDPEVYRDGVPVALFDGPPEVMEGVCAYLRTEQVKSVDWYYAGGRAVVKVLPPDEQLARQVLDRPLLTRLR
jgi:hypothetical protein